MKNIIAAIILASSIVYAATSSQPNMDGPGTWGDNVDRVCANALDWTEIDCSAGAAYSAALSQWSKVIFVATGGDPYFHITTSSSGDDPAAGDGILPENSWYEHGIMGSTVYAACDGSGDSSKVSYAYCK